MYYTTPGLNIPLNADFLYTQFVKWNKTSWIELVSSLWILISCYIHDTLIETLS